MGRELPRMTKLTKSQGGPTDCHRPEGPKKMRRQCSVAPGREGAPVGNQVQWVVWELVCPSVAVWAAEPLQQ